MKEGVAAGKKPVVTVINDEANFFFADSDNKYPVLRGGNNTVFPQKESE